MLLSNRLSRADLAHLAAGATVAWLVLGNLRPILAAIVWAGS